MRRFPSSGADTQVSTRCPISTTALGLADPMLYSDGDFRAIWRDLRGMDHLTWQQVDPHHGFRELFAYFQDIYRDRRRKLSDDLISVLITTEVDGRVMSPSEVVSNCYSVLLYSELTPSRASRSGSSSTSS